MAEESNITRRAAIVGAAASSLTLALVAAPAIDGTAQAAEPDAEIYRLADEWRRQYEITNGATEAAAGIEADAPEFHALNAIEKKIAAMRPTTAQGFAVKFVVLTNFGEFTDIEGISGCLFEDARSVVGIDPPSSLA